MSTRVILSIAVVLAIFAVSTSSQSIINGPKIAGGGNNTRAAGNGTVAKTNGSNRVSMTLDIPPPVFTKFDAAPKGRECFTHKDVTLRGANGPQLAWQNVGGCSCKEARDRVLHSRRDGGYAPQCDDSTGKFSKEQGWGSTGSSWCADPTTGHQISQSQGSGRGSATLNC